MDWPLTFPDWLTVDRAIAIASVLAAVGAALLSWQGLRFAKRTQQESAKTKLPQVVLTVFGQRDDGWRPAIIRTPKIHQLDHLMVSLSAPKPWVLRRPGASTGPLPSKEPSSEPPASTLSINWEVFPVDLQYNVLPFFMHEARSLFKRKSKTVSIRLMVEEKSTRRLRTEIPIISNVLP